MKTFIENIDWKLLVQQKMSLLYILNKDENTDAVQNDLEGILQLLDNLQDYAVDELGILEEIVFPYIHQDE